MKKVLKTIGKCFAWFFGVLFGFLALLCVITLAWGHMQHIRGSVTESLPETPADFVPAIRIVTFNDSHNQNDRVADAIDTAYELFDNDAVYPGVDAFVYNGDFSSVGFEGDYEAFAQTYKEHVRPETPFINVIGNHEFKQTYYEELFRKHFGQELNTLTEINGFSLIGFSGYRGLTEWTFTPGSLKWLADSLKAAEAKADGEPVFVFQHPHPWGTVYGSTVWGDPQLNVIFAKYPNVVDFSGHSHFPMSDPRSINQSLYTAVGCGATRTFELDNNGIVGQHPDGYDLAAEICVVEADHNGAVRIRGYDLNSDTCFCDYFIANVNDRDSFAYTYKNMKAHDTAPVFSDGTKATAFRNENGEWVISFDEAKSSFIVHEYKVTIKDADGKTVLSKNFIDDYFVFDEDDTADFRIGNDTLVSGESYTLQVRAESAYHLYSDIIEIPFTAQ